MSIEHQAVRPAWTCATDHEPWPCELARKILTEVYHYDRPLLSSQLAALMRRAADDLGLGDPARLYHRFVGWTLEDHRACRVCGRGGHDAVPGLPPRLVPCDILRRLGEGDERTN